MIQQLLLIIHVLIAISLVGIVLLQHGKGADMGASFGSAASQALFGGQGSGTFLTRLTAGLATAFFVTSISLAYIAGQQTRSQQQFDIPVPVETPSETPVVPQSNTDLDLNAIDSNDIRIVDVEGFDGADVPVLSDTNTTTDTTEHTN